MSFRLYNPTKPERHLQKELSHLFLHKNQLTFQQKNLVFILFTLKYSFFYQEILFFLLKRNENSLFSIHFLQKFTKIILPEPFSILPLLKRHLPEDFGQMILLLGKHSFASRKLP